jgi:uncharacterized protein YbjT (DUF2867 family)
MKTVLITGANGFIARHLARTLAGEGWRVIGVSRSGLSLPHVQAMYRASLEDPLATVLASEPVDAIVHTANASGPDEYRLNVEGTNRWADEARAAGVQLQILLSSLSASATAVSDYGRAKYALEQRFMNLHEIVLSLGVVIGNGGMYARMSDSLHGAITPLLDGGRARIHVLGIDFLCNVIRDCIRQPDAGLRGRVWRIQQPQPYSLLEVLATIKRVNGLRCRLLPVPSLPFLWMCLLAEALGIRLPVTATNIRGVRQARYDRFESDFTRFGYPPQSLEELVSQVGDQPG